MHLKDQTLRNYLDHELPAEEQQTAADHLAVSAQCSQRLREIEERAARVHTHLAVLDPGALEGAGSGGQRTQPIPKLKKEKQQMSKAKALRPLWVALTVVAVVAVALSFQPVRAYARTLLSNFRVQQVQVLSLDMTVLRDMGDDPTLGEAVSQLFS